LALQTPHYAQHVEIRAVYVDLGFGDQAEMRCQATQTFFDRTRVQGTIVRTDIGPYAHSDANRENPCFLCSRMKRRRIFECAEALGCNKIVFGHHKDDIVETLLINMIWGREISTMIPNLAVFQGKYHVLRPLLYVEEVLIKKFARERALIPIEQECPSDGHTKRQYVKEMLDRLDHDFKGAKENIFASMKCVKKDYLL